MWTTVFVLIISSLRGYEASGEHKILKDAPDCCEGRGIAAFHGLYNLSSGLYRGQEDASRQPPCFVNPTGHKDDLAADTLPVRWNWT